MGSRVTTITLKVHTKTLTSFWFSIFRYSVLRARMVTRTFPSCEQNKKIGIILDVLRLKKKMPPPPQSQMQFPREVKLTEDILSKWGLLARVLNGCLRNITQLCKATNPVISCRIEGNGRYYVHISQVQKEKYCMLSLRRSR